MKTTLLVVSLFAVGCMRNASVSVAVDPKENLTGAQRVQAAVPALRRAVTLNDLDQLRTWIATDFADGKYPKALAELRGLQQQAPNLYKLVNDGDIVLAGGAGGVIAYEKAALDNGGLVATTSSIGRMEAADLKKALGR